MADRIGNNGNNTLARPTKTSSMVAGNDGLFGRAGNDELFGRLATTNYGEAGNDTPMVEPASTNLMVGMVKIAPSTVGMAMTFNGGAGNDLNGGDGDDFPMGILLVVEGEWQ